MSNYSNNTQDNPSSLLWNKYNIHPICTWYLYNKHPHMAAHQGPKHTTIILILHPEINVSFLYQPAIISQWEGVYKYHTLIWSITESSGAHHQAHENVCVFVEEQRLSHTGLFKLIKKCLIDYTELGCCVAGSPHSLQSFTVMWSHHKGIKTDLFAPTFHWSDSTNTMTSDQLLSTKVLL